VTQPLLRPATAADSSFLRTLRNDPEVRRRSRQPGVVGEDEHEAWLDGVLADPEHRRLYVIELDATPQGQVRLDRDGTSAEVSIALAAHARGRGVGRSALAATRTVARELEIDELHAFVQENNPASLRLFAAAGYSELRRSQGLVELALPVGRNE
jgi:RimJ/RimL family protein N-acetyltransferase